MDAPDKQKVEKSLKKTNNLQLDNIENRTVKLEVEKDTTEEQLDVNIARFKRALENRGLKLMEFGNGNSLYDLTVRNGKLLAGVVVVDIDGPRHENEIEVNEK